MTIRAVYDTNVIVSGTLRVGSIPASLVAWAMAKHVQLFISPPTFAEYAEVLKRPKFGFKTEDVDRFLRDLRRAAVMVYPTQRVAKTLHEPDNRFLECAQAARADYLVTGDKRHFPFLEFGGTKIVSPATLALTVAIQNRPDR